MQLVCLGTAGYHASDTRQTSCYLLPAEGIVLDAGTGMYRVRDWLATPTLDIFLSHAHLDHAIGLTYLFDVARGKNLTRISVHGDERKLAVIREHLFQPDLFPALPPVEWRPLQPTFRVGAATIAHFPLEHPGGSTGYRLDWPNRSLAYVTDTTARPGANYVERIRGVDLLLHECNFPDTMPELAEKTGHSCTSAVARVAAAAGVQRLVLTHFDPLNASDDPVGLPIARQIFPHTELAVDGGSIEF
jgi:ribonuclease BN (tRNA processing enzyme)